MLERLIDELIPILGILMIIALVIGPVWIRSYFVSKERARLHETLRIAYEKGQPVPPELIRSLQSTIGDQSISTPERDLRRAIILIAVGLSLCGVGYALYYGLLSAGTEGTEVAAYIAGGCTAAAGAIPGLIGVAYLILWFTKRNAPKA